MNLNQSVNEAATGYQANAVAGLSDEDRLLKGIRGVAVYLKRATMTSGDPGTVKAARIRHLSDCDRLLAFLEGIADGNTELGATLVTCYQGIRRLILEALTVADPSEAIDAAYRQAHELESVIKQELTSHD